MVNLPVALFSMSSFGSHVQDSSAGTPEVSKRYACLVNARLIFCQHAPAGVADLTRQHKGTVLI